MLAVFCDFSDDKSQRSDETDIVCIDDEKCIIVEMYNKYE